MLFGKMKPRYKKTRIMKMSKTFVINQNVEEEECIYCLCRPCISSEKNRQMWWLEDPVAPNRSNFQRRKDKYKRFWTMLFQRNVWRDPRYIERKRNALRQDPLRKNYIYHRRNLMPKYVVSKVRYWLPDLNGSYVGVIRINIIWLYCEIFSL